MICALLFLSESAIKDDLARQVQPSGVALVSRITVGILPGVDFMRGGKMFKELPAGNRIRI
jgi:hypothetical protein